MSNDQLAENYADTVRTSLDELFARYDKASEWEDGPGSDDDEVESREDVQAEIDQYALELVAEVGEPFQVVITVGGPDARIVWHGRYGTRNARLEVNWGGDEAKRYGAGITRMAEWFEDYMTSGDI